MMKKKMRILILGVIVIIILLFTFLLVRVLSDSDSPGEKGNSGYCVTGTIVNLKPLSIYTDGIPGYTIFSLQTNDDIDISKLSLGQKIQVYYSGNATDFGLPSMEGVSEIIIVGNSTDEELSSMLECYQEYLNAQRMP